MSDTFKIQTKEYWGLRLFYIVPSLTDMFIFSYICNILMNNLQFCLQRQEKHAEERQSENTRLAEAEALLQTLARKTEVRHSNYTRNTQDALSACKILFM